MWCGVEGGWKRGGKGRGRGVEDRGGKGRGDEPAVGEVVHVVNIRNIGESMVGNEVDM